MESCLMVSKHSTTFALLLSECHSSSSVSSQLSFVYANSANGTLQEMMSLKVWIFFFGVNWCEYSPLLPCVRWKLFLLAQHNCDGNVPFYMTLNTSVCSTKSVCTSSERRHCVGNCIQTRQKLLRPTFLPHRILHLRLVFFCTYVCMYVF